MSLNFGCLVQMLQRRGIEAIALEIVVAMQRARKQQVSSMMLLLAHPLSKSPLLIVAEGVAVRGRYRSDEVEEKQRKTR